VCICMQMCACVCAHVFGCLSLAAVLTREEAGLFIQHMHVYTQTTCKRIPVSYGIFKLPYICSFLVNHLLSTRVKVPELPKQSSGSQGPHCPWQYSVQVFRILVEELDRLQVIFWSVP
jgi:hypothetical protein